MSVSQVQPGDVIDVRPLGAAFADSRTSTLIQSEHVKVIRMVMPAGKVLSEHKSPGEIIVHCLDGKIAFTTMGKTEALVPGTMLNLSSGELHSVEAIEDSSFLLTIVSTDK